MVIQSNFKLLLYFFILRDFIDPVNKNEPEECCNRPTHLKNPYCMEIPVPEEDYFYRKYNVRCLDFVRAFPSVRPGCKLGLWKTTLVIISIVISSNQIYYTFCFHISDRFTSTFQYFNWCYWCQYSVWSERKFCEVTKIFRY